MCMAEKIEILLDVETSINFLFCVASHLPIQGAWLGLSVFSTISPCTSSLVISTTINSVGLSKIVPNSQKNMLTRLGPRELHYTTQQTKRCSRHIHRAWRVMTQDREARGVVSPPLPLELIKEKHMIPNRLQDCLVVHTTRTSMPALPSVGTHYSVLSNVEIS